MEKKINNICLFVLVKWVWYSKWKQDSSASVEKDSSAPRHFGTRWKRQFGTKTFRYRWKKVSNRHRIFFQTNVITFNKINCLFQRMPNCLVSILNTRLYLHIILYIWIFPRYLLFYSIFDKMSIDKHIYNNNWSLKQSKHNLFKGYFSKYFVLNIETKIFYQYKKTNIVYFLFHIKSEFTNLVNDLDVISFSMKTTVWICICFIILLELFSV
jgi:hypothetical protein